MPCQRTVNIKSSSKALKEVDHPNSVFALDFDFYSDGKPTYLARVLTSLFVILNMHGEEELGREISIQHDLITHVQLQADKNQEELGKRMIAYIDISLHRLYTNHYISYVLRRDENVRITTTESLQKIFKKLKDRVIVSNKFNSLTELSFKEHRALCNSFHTLMKRKTMAIEKARTRKQLLEENLVLRRDLEEALAGQITGQSNPLPHTSSIDSSSSSGTMSTDSFVISDSLQSTSLKQILETPIRKKPMLDIPGAYPTPESLPRRLGTDTHAQTISPPGTPTYGYHTDGQESQDMDVGIATSLAANSLQHLLPISEIFGPNWTSESGEHKTEAHFLKSRLLRRMLRGRVSEVINENKWKRKYEALKTGFQAHRTISKAKVEFYTQCFQTMGAIASHAQSFNFPTL
ncbi:hypothetical protein BJ912DRAFT_1110335 [Pholiota molesta]|nr:hypothetical protein BJ912DRAFT_1110335 [Pholiota molesta]